MPFGIPSEVFHGGFGLPEVRDIEQEPDEAQVAYDNLARELMEAEDTIQSLQQDKACLIHYLKDTVKWLDYFITTNPDDLYIEEARTARWAAESRLMDLTNQ